MDVVLLFPGQGSQKPGMGKDVADAFPAARAAFGEVDDALVLPITRLCFEGPADELTLTLNAQPALLTHSAAVWAATRERLAPYVRAAAGHSLGELSAYHAASSLTLSSAARLVRRRGELMFDSGIATPGAMAAILGDLAEPIESVCDRATREAALVVPANYNSPGQVVVSGAVAGVERAMVLAKEAGAKRAMRLSVSGAFHSPLMASAVPGFAVALRESSMADPVFPVYANVSASAVRTAAAAEELLARQLTAPVRWTDCVRSLVAAYPGALYVEMGTGIVLTGLVKKIAPDVETAPCGSAAEVDQLLERLG